MFCPEIRRGWLIAAPKKPSLERFRRLSQTCIRKTSSPERHVKESKVARNGFEIIPEKVTLVAKASVPLPLDPRGVTPQDSIPDSHGELST